MRRSPLKRSTPLRAKKPLRRANKARLTKRRAEQFGAQAEACRRMACCVCWARPAEPHHVRSRGAGGRDKDCVPLCRYHHDMVHRVGRKTFERLCRIDLQDEAQRIAEALKC